MPTILIVDDEPMIRLTLRRHLERAGYAVAEAGNGLEALAALGRGSFDLILLDIIMPQAEGIETVLAIRREGSRVPIIAMSGGGRNKDEDFLELAQKLGADEILRKPFAYKDLLRMAARFTTGAQPEVANNEHRAA